MSFVIRGLPAGQFEALFGLPDDVLAARGIIRKTAQSKPGFPCRITLEDAEPGETLLLLNYESHGAPTPYRSSYAIFVRESARAAGVFVDELPPVMECRPIALRVFDGAGMLIGADLGLNREETRGKIEAAFANPKSSYIHAHNAKHGCFAAEIRRGD